MGKALPTFQAGYANRKQRRIDKAHARRSEVMKSRHIDPTKGTEVNRPTQYERLAQSTRDRLKWLKDKKTISQTEKSKLPGFARRFLDKLGIGKESTDGDHEQLHSGSDPGPNQGSGEKI